MDSPKNAANTQPGKEFLIHFTFQGKLVTEVRSFLLKQLHLSIIDAFVLDAVEIKHLNKFHFQLEYQRLCF